ncbi:hypothetical protein WICMUC_004622 [Wickerhamomyces mucosus]|uniref:Transcription elongation factor Eaf N-terminal domain-containing protein n=1 Tax=Wickerhamomyces mucosus TaxID=1378264 RepID=A0A9P8PGD4_9ASCO|nr:hypothetical protein WICMUC_004622 [Wickerhamomyces mucosus]
MANTSLDNYETKDQIDVSKPFQLLRDGSSDLFELKTDIVDSTKGMTFKGTVGSPDVETKDSNLNCVLIFNQLSNTFELTKVDNELQTTSIKEEDNSEKEEETTTTIAHESNNASSKLSDQLKPHIFTKSPPIFQQQPSPPAFKKRVHKEPSIFQPKQRTRAPSNGASTVTRPKKLTPNENSTPSPPLHQEQTVKLERPMSSNGRISSPKPSPLSLSSYPPQSSKIYGSPERKKTPEINKKKSKKLNKTPPNDDDINNNISSSESTPKTSTNGGRATLSQIASKRPPSASVTTPTISHVETPTDVRNNDSEEVDELELDELVDQLDFDNVVDDDDNGFIIVEDQNKNNGSTSSVMEFKFDDSDDRRPRSLRDFVGAASNNDDENDISSSEEE